MGRARSGSAAKLLAEHGPGAPRPPLPRWVLVGGKGGVGKTTVAASLAVRLADAGLPVLVFSSDPAHSLGDALGQAVGPEPNAVPGAPRLHALELDAGRERAGFLARHDAQLRELLTRGTYLAADEVEQLLGLAVPGMDELAALLRLLELVDDERYAHVVLDTAPTGHTLRLLASPDLARRWLAALAALEARGRTVAEAFGAAPAATSSLLARLYGDLDRLAGCLTDPAHTLFLLVTTPEPMVLAETRRYRDALGQLGITRLDVVVNRVAAGQSAGRELRQALGDDLGGLPTTCLPLLEHEPHGLERLRALAALAAPLSHHPVDRGSPIARAGALHAPRPAGTIHEAGREGVLRIGEGFRPPADRQLYLVGGKGGVGKTTIASALGVWLAESAGRRVLLLSADPAGSLADVWAVPVGPEAVRAPQVPNLELRQLDAAAAWEVVRHQYGAEAGGLVARLVAGPVDERVDQRAVERLLELAPPGIDELMALLEVVDLLGESTYNALVLDTAPTGHLLRLLETPGLALEWAHLFMRLLLRYREVVGLGEAAERLLEFTRAVRALQGRLQDRSATWVAVVALPEALSVAETARLLSRLPALGMAADVLVINRLLEAGKPAAREQAARALLALEGVPVAVAAPEWASGPGCPDELRRFADAWRYVESS